MWETILATLTIMGYLGIILSILVLINTICGIVKNTSEGQKFSVKILFKGLLKALIFYLCSSLLSIAFSMIPEVNGIITDVAGVQLFGQDTLITLSNVAVFTVTVSAIVAQGKKALEGVIELLSVKVNTEDLIGGNSSSNLTQIESKETKSRE